MEREEPEPEWLSRHRTRPCPREQALKITLSGKIPSSSGPKLPSNTVFGLIPNFDLLMLGGFSLLALAVVDVYAFMAHSVSQPTGEIGAQWAMFGVNYSFRSRIPIVADHANLRPMAFSLPG
jgi:hypothetical protein